MMPAEFIRKWERSTLKESAAAQQHFLDLCDLLDGTNGIAVTVSTETTPEGAPIILVTDSYGKTDTLISIEMIVGTENADSVDLDALSASAPESGLTAAAAMIAFSAATVMTN